MRTDIKKTAGILAGAAAFLLAFSAPAGVCLAANIPAAPAALSAAGQDEEKELKTGETRNKAAGQESSGSEENAAADNAGSGETAAGQENAGGGETGAAPDTAVTRENASMTESGGTGEDASVPENADEAETAAQEEREEQASKAPLKLRVSNWEEYIDLGD